MNNVESHRRTSVEVAQRLLDVARSLGRPEEDLVDLRVGFEDYSAGAQQMAALLETTAGMRREGLISSEDDHRSHAQEEVGAFYALTQDALEDADALRILRTTAPMIAATRLQAEAAGLYRKLVDHLDGYGWVRVRGYRFEPPGPKELIDRLETVVHRWPAEVVKSLAYPVDPAEALARRSLEPEILLQAECIARPFFLRIAHGLGCSLMQVLFSSADDMKAALDGKTALPLGDIDARIANATGDAGAVVLSGITGCRGRATGPVRIIFDASDLYRLQFGDVLVTAASTTDFAGGATVFPTRGGGPDALSRAAAVVTDEGGALSHGAIVCRERGIPCVLGVERATTDLAEGQVVDVDATRQLGQALTLDG